MFLLVILTLSPAFLIVIPEGDLLLSLSLPFLLLLLLPFFGCHPVGICFCRCRCCCCCTLQLQLQLQLPLSLSLPSPFVAVASFCRHPERSNSRTLRVAEPKDPDTDPSPIHPHLSPQNASPPPATETIIPVKPPNQATY